MDLKLLSPDEIAIESQYQPERERSLPPLNTRNVMPTCNRPFRDDRWLTRSGLIYDGSPTGMTIEDFLFRLERIARNRGISQDSLVDEMGTTLRGTAQEWYWCHLRRNPLISWQRLRENLLDRFQDRRTPYDIRRMVESRKQMRKESIVDYYNQILALTVQAPALFPDDEIMHIIRRGMKPGLQLAVAGRTFNTIGELIQHVVSVEDEWIRLGHDPDQLFAHRRYVHELDANITSGDYVNEIIPADDEYLRHQPSADVFYETPSESSSQASITISALVPQNKRTPSPSRNRAVHFQDSGRYNTRPNSSGSQTQFQREFSTEPDVCWNCHVLGHWFKNCPKPNQHIFCFGCGRTEVIKPRCVNCNSGNVNRGIPFTGKEITKPTQPRNLPDLRQTNLPTSPHQNSQFRMLKPPVHSPTGTNRQH